MSLLLLVLILAYLIPGPWSRWMWDKLLCSVWNRSTLKVVVDAGGRKLTSYKDKIQTKKNVPEVKS